MGIDMVVVLSGGAGALVGLSVGPVDEPTISGTVSG